MFAINGEKSHGPDGYTSHFFKVAWSIIDKDVMNVVLYFFHSNDLLHAFISIVVALVPKCQNLNRIIDYRHIFYCLVTYKCITKIMANKLKTRLPTIIGNNQSAFLVGKSITDNILMAQELVKGYGRSTLSPTCAIKVYLQKAFDSLPWNFILEVLSVFVTPQPESRTHDNCRVPLSES